MRVWVLTRTTHFAGLPSLSIKRTPSRHPHFAIITQLCHFSSSVPFNVGKNFQAVRCPCLAPRAVRIASSKSPVENDAKALSANVRLKSNSRLTKCMPVFAESPMTVFAALTCRSDSLRSCINSLEVEQKKRLPCTPKDTDRRQGTLPSSGVEADEPWKRASRFCLRVSPPTRTPS